MNRVVIISSGQPSANPRAVKEALLLSKNNYEVIFIYCPLSPWADEFDSNLFHNYPSIQWKQAGYHSVKQKWGYRFARFRKKVYQQIFRILGNRFDASVYSMALFSRELIREAKKHKAELYIGHNLGALPAAVKAAGKNNSFVSFDFEDFHRGEAPENSLHWKKASQVEKKYVPSLTFATVASPLIGTAYHKIFPGISFTTINNCFPLSYAVNKPAPVKPLKLFWFSQTIGQKRGLETVIEAMGKMSNGQVGLSLLGNCRPETKAYFREILKRNGLDINCVQFIDPVEESQIVAIAAMHDIGLACEIPHILNREICLTNKVFMYLLAANAIIFSHTRAQSLFLREHPGIGVSYAPDNANELATLLNNYINDPGLLQQHRVTSLKLGVEHLNWEIEGEVLLQKINEVTKKKK